MAKLTFKGGIHPYDGKELSKDKPIVELSAEEVMVYPLSQHIGAPAKAVVGKGENVRRGQLIAEAGGFVSAPIYSSVSGVVKAIEPRRVASGDMVMSIVIENDGLGVEEEYEATEYPEELSGEEILAKIQRAGIVGMGGAGFPTHVKLSPKEPEKIEYVIANCAECEPYLTSDYRRMLEEPEKLVGGLKIILQLFDKAQGIIAIEDNKPDCVKLLRDLTRGETRISVRTLQTKYPQGGERALIYATTGRKVNSSMLPADVGAIVNNVDTIVAVYRAVKEGIPLMERIVTVTGDAIKNPRNYKVPIGMSYTAILEAAGGFATQPEKIICGGAARSGLWKTILADVLGIPLSDTQTEQAPALGAAMLASVACGVYPSVAECAGAVVQRKDTVYPDRRIMTAYQGHYFVWHQIYPALKGIYQQML